MLTKGNFDELQGGIDIQMSSLEIDTEKTNTSEFTEEDYALFHTIFQHEIASLNGTNVTSNIMPGGEDEVINLASFELKYPGRFKKMLKERFEKQRLSFQKAKNDKLRNDVNKSEVTNFNSILFEYGQNCKDRITWQIMFILLCAIFFFPQQLMQFGYFAIIYFLCSNFNQVKNKISNQTINAITTNTIDTY